MPLCGDVFEFAGELIVCGGGVDLDFGADAVATRWLKSRVARRGLAVGGLWRLRICCGRTKRKWGSYLPSSTVIARSSPMPSERIDVVATAAR